MPFSRGHAPRPLTTQLSEAPSFSRKLLRLMGGRERGLLGRPTHRRRRERAPNNQLRPQVGPHRKFRTMKMPKMLILIGAVVVTLGLMAIGQQRVASSGNLQDIERLMVERLGSVPANGRFMTPIASSSSNGMGEGGASFTGTYEELVADGGLNEAKFDRGVQRSIFSVDAGGSNILLVATTYHRYLDQGLEYDDSNNNTVFTTRLDAFDLSDGAVLWTTTLMLDGSND